jgi:hypothetical protein
MDNLKIALKPCCDKTDQNTKLQHLKYSIENERIYTDVNKFAACFYCGKNLCGTAYIECEISEYTGTIKTWKEIMHEVIQHMSPIQLDHMGMTE